jgi:phosphotransferase system  glucose/maltose/N-acetylglucosamine-specific IIC component
MFCVVYYSETVFQLIFLLTTPWYLSLTHSLIPHSSFFLFPFLKYIHLHASSSFSFSLFSLFLYVQMVQMNINHDDRITWINYDMKCNYECFMFWICAFVVKSKKEKKCNSNTQKYNKKMKNHPWNLQQ